MIDYKIYHNTNEIPEAWDLLPTGDIFLKTTFLKGLESSCPSNISSYYLGVFKNKELVGVAIIQRVEMYLDDVFRKTSNRRVKQISKNVISKIVRGNALVIGNLMHTGQHGIFKLETISQSDYLDTVYKAIKELEVEIKARFNKKVRIIAFKDYFEKDTIHSNLSFFKQHNLYKIQVQPNMMFSILNKWKSKEDYIASFNKKYKRRYRIALKKAANLELRELDKNFIKNHSKSIFKLYENVSDNARVNSFKLPEDHFLSLKLNLKSNFKLFGYFLEEELVGFYSLILNNNELETYFLGYNKAFQQKHQMYLNMLYNMAFFGIEHGFKTVVYARTAMEIKSSIGAKAHTMHIYLKHTNNVIANTVLKCIVKYMNPIQTWQERHPFKDYTVSHLK